jgi:alcohol dehydrogenase
VASVTGMISLSNPSGLSGLPSFELPGRPRLVFGEGAAGRSGELASFLGARRALLVTDSGIVAAGHAQRVAESLRAAGITVAIYGDVHENPTTRDVDDCLAVARESAIDLIVGLGGGSAMDTAKATNLLLGNGGRMQDYWGVGRAIQPMLPLVAIPTTAGTGSEMQSAALIADDVTHQKMACLDPKVLPAVSILDPALTLSQPRRVAANTGMDAIVHAVETAVTTKRSDDSAALSAEAFRLCVNALPRVLAEPGDLESRGRMQLGAAFAGAAIERSMLGAAHAAANPLTARFGVVHGNAVGLMLPHVVRFNAALPEVRDRYAELAATAGLVEGCHPAEKAVDALVECLERLLRLAQLPGTAGALGVRVDAIASLAGEAARQWTAGFNPRPVFEGDFVKLYQAALGVAS